MGPTANAPKRWTPGAGHTLQRAPQFEGRDKLRAELATWAVAADDPNRVVALVAVGGTGKTALAERVADGLQNHTAAGVFVWSFDENPQTEAVLRAACEYFLGEAPKETGGLLERLQAGLRADGLPHLFVLDGLELVQAPGTTGRPRGEFEDPLLKRFLRWLAAGLGTRAKALITTRFPLPDLADWAGKGYRPVPLDDLDPPAARALFRKWGVKGTDAVLDTLAESVHRHALTVDVLGSYLGTYHAGDPAQAPSFDPQFFIDTDGKTARLHQVLASYAEKLTDRERDLLARLSLFPRGAGVDILAYVIDAGGAVAAALAGCKPLDVLKLLERLRALGLVFRYDRGRRPAFTAHPFLRGFFEGLVGVDDTRQVYEVVRSKLAVGLVDLPREHPTRPADLDRYERLIEITWLAGKAERAYDLYYYGLGNYGHLGHVLGESARGLRILAGFSTDGTPCTTVNSLRERLRARVGILWGLHAIDLGDLRTARQGLEIHDKYTLRMGESLDASTGLTIRSGLEHLAGRWPAALEAASAALRMAAGTGDSDRTGTAYAYLAASCFGLGLLSDALRGFAFATRYESQPLLYSRRVLYEAELKLASGDRIAARVQTEANQVVWGSNWVRDIAQCDTLLGLCALPDDPRRAGTHLTAAREFAGRSGDVEVALRCYQLAAAKARCENNISLAVSEALDGIQLADSTGFGRWSLDIRAELARSHLAAGEPAKAIEPAEWVLRRSLEEDCQYAWGVADSLHLLGIAYSRIKGRGNKAKARDYLRRAVEKRAPLEHPGLADTQAELAKLGG